ncbi:MAG: GWxTD domain-containing protein [Bacteroidia bacterium]|nr:GWxTD domain-containing protein [Bacteroidia bacterium]HQU99770.1 GWxTD domain-containing protein [Bacteroidia bacterium]
MTPYRFIKNNVILVLIIYLLNLTANAQHSTVPITDNQLTLQPQFCLYQYSTDSLMLWLQLNNDGLQYENDSMPVALVNVNLFVLEKAQSKKYLDQDAIHFKVIATDENYTTVKMFFAKPAIQQFVIKLEVVDVQAKNKTVQFRQFNQTGLITEISMLATQNNGLPYFGNWVKTTDSVNVFASTVPMQKAWMRYFKFNNELPLPPHVTVSQNTFSYIADSAVEVNYTQQTFVLNKPGLYHFQADTMQKNGFTLMSFDSDFPNINRTQDMLPPLRYLTTNAEFEKMQQAENKTTAMQEFWTKCAGDKMKSRKLIEAYYYNVQYANLNFTSYIAGWQTDRGLIYIIMGPPDAIDYNEKTIVWSYNLNFGQNLFFEFIKMNNPFSQNDYMLQRAADFETPWYQAVNKWRQGQTR